MFIVTYFYLVSLAPILDKCVPFLFFIIIVYYFSLISMFNVIVLVVIYV